MSDPNLSSFIWSVADLLRGDYKQSEYGKVILPFTVLRRLDCVLEETKAAVSAEKEKREKAGLNAESFLLKKSGQLFYNTSPLDLKKLMGDQDHIGENLRAYHSGIVGHDGPQPRLQSAREAGRHGHYDDNQVDRVVAVELDPNAKQGELISALEPVVDRLLKRYKAAQQDLKTAREQNDDAAAQAAQDQLDALLLFKTDIGTFIRLYTFLSQIFNYGNTAIEKRAIFFKRLLPLLEFGREREGIDLSKMFLTHHLLKNTERRSMPLYGGPTPKLEPIVEVGSGAPQAKDKALLEEIIQKVNELFTGELTDQDKLVYVNSVIKGKLLESETLRQQAANNTKEQFANSPDLKTELLNAIMGALDAHTAMSTQALNSAKVQAGLKDILLNHAGLWEGLREQAAK